MKDNIARIKAPTLILWGSDDNLVPVETAHAFAARIPGAKTIVYRHTGHIPQEEVPDKSAADVRAFLTGKMAGLSSAQ
jgi:pimeloyl-ACP methyl ester carboxylesterase